MIYFSLYQEKGKIHIVVKDDVTKVRYSNHIVYDVEHLNEYIEEYTTAGYINYTDTEKGKEYKKGLRSILKV